jgi:hypothetical protein
MFLSQLEKIEYTKSESFSAKDGDAHGVR